MAASVYFSFMLLPFYVSRILLASKPKHHKKPERDCQTVGARRAVPFYHDVSTWPPIWDKPVGARLSRPTAHFGSMILKKGGMTPPLRPIFND